MVMTDPLADMLTRIRNAGRAGHDKVEIPNSNMKVSIVKILKDEGYIKNFRVIDDRKQGVLRVYLKYDEENKPMIKGIERVSRPSLRVYVKKDKIPKVLNGLGIHLLSTSQGIMSEREARKEGFGGELLCKVW